MTKYYYLSPALPPLELEQENSISWPFLKDLLKDCLSPKDWDLVKIVRLRYDLENLRHLWLKEPLDPLGNFDAFSLEAAIAYGTDLPEYVFDFLREHDTLEARLKAFPQLIAAYFREEQKTSEGFLKEYLQFEREMRLVLVGLRAKALERDLAQELQYEDPLDPFVQQILAQKESHSFEPPYGYEALKTLLEQHSLSPTGLQRAVLEYQFRHWRDLSVNDLFSIDRILSYIVKFATVKRWQELDNAYGLEIIDSIVKDVS